MQGVFLHGSRPQTKKTLKEVVEAVEVVKTATPAEEQPQKGEGHQHDGYCVVLEATSMFGNEYDGSLENAPKASAFYVVGPDPRTSRKWYATIYFNDKKGRWEVK